MRDTPKSQSGELIKETKYQKNRGVQGVFSIEAALCAPIILLSFTFFALILFQQGQEDILNQILFESTRIIDDSGLQTSAQLKAFAQIEVRKNLQDKHWNFPIESIECEVSDEGSYDLSVKWRKTLPFVGTKSIDAHLGSRIMSIGNGILDSDDIVYVTKTGHLYHLVQCMHLNRSSLKKTLKEAIEDGYEACWHCVGRLEPFKRAPGPDRPQFIQ